MMGVLRQSLVLDFGEAELTFHRTEDVLDFGADSRFAAVPGTVFLTERDMAATFFIRKIFCLGTSSPRWS